MTGALIVVSLLMALMYPALGIAWWQTRSGKPKAHRWLGIVAILAAGPFFTCLGLFLATTDDGLCYSEVIETVAALPRASTDPGGAPNRRSSIATALHLEGYETNCHEVRDAARELAERGGVVHGH